EDEERGPRSLLLIDDPDGLEARRGPSRTMLRLGLEPSSGVAVMTVVGEGPVPAGSLVLRIGPDGSVRGRDGMGARADGLAPDTAAHAARSLARAADAEIDDTDLRLPARVELADLLGAENLGPGAIIARWRAAGSDPAPAAVLGAGTDGACP